MYECEHKKSLLPAKAGKSAFLQDFDHMLQIFVKDILGKALEISSSLDMKM